MKRTLFWESADTLEPVINMLKNKGLCEPTVWVACNPKATHHVHDFDYFRFEDYQYYGIPDDLRNRLEKYKMTFVEMYSRNYNPAEQNSYSPKTIHDMINIFNMLSDMFYRIFIENKIDFVVLCRLPHLGPDYLMFRLAEEMNIDRLTFQPDVFIDTDYFSYVYNLDDFGEFNDILPINSDESVKIEKLTSEPSVYIKANPYYLEMDKIMNDFYKPVDFKQLVKELRKKRTRRTAFQRYDLGREILAELAKYEKDELDLDCNYVYFPLHYQPEMTTSLLGREYCDQILAVERLSKILPENWKIIVKENMIQGHFQRGEAFYTRLMGIKNVELASRKFDTFKLISNAKIIAAITGTVGWESICSGKNVVVFGQAWYKKFPGVFEYSPDLDLEEVVKNVIDHSEIEKFAGIYKSKMAKGFMYDYSLEIVSNENNLKDLERFFRHQINLFDSKRKLVGKV